MCSKSTAIATSIAVKAKYSFEWLAGAIPEEQRTNGIYIDDGDGGCWTLVTPKPRTEREQKAAHTAAVVDFRKTAYYEGFTRCVASLYVDGRCALSQVFVYTPKER